MSYSCLSAILQIILYRWLNAEWNSFPPFPMHGFFDNSNTDEVLSKYVCSYNPVEMKYCSCSKYSFMNNNWCIDVFWMDKDDFTLDTYMVYFEEKYLDMLAKNNYLTCKPIIYPAKRNHLVERVMMHSTYIDENNVRKKCLNETIGYGPLSVAVYDEALKDVYINEFCAIKNKAKNIKRLEVMAICLNIDDIQANMTMNSNVMEKLDGCEFSYSQRHGMGLQSCANEDNECPEDDEYYVLCNAYLAPTNGYRNHHCYICANRKNIEQKDMTLNNRSKIEIKGSNNCLRGLCYFGINYKFSDKNVIHIGYDEKSKDLRVSRVEYIFPAAKFYNAYKYRFDPKRKFLDGYCCLNTKSCWKYKTCCPDILWNNSKRIALDLYKELLVNNTAQYKDSHCEQLIPHSRYPLITISYLMITTCLSNATEVQFKACTTVTWQNAQSYMPVIGEDHYLYRNSFCALCNSIHNFIYVDVGSSRFRGVFKFFIKPFYEQIIQSCDKSIPSNDTCPSGHPYQKLCKSFLGPTQSYRNIFCHLCNYPNDKITFSKCPRRRLIYFWTFTIELDRKGKIRVYSTTDAEHIHELILFLEKGCIGTECLFHEMVHKVENFLTRACVNKKDFSLYVIKKENSLWNDIITNLMLIFNVTDHEYQSKTNKFPVMRLDFNISFDQLITKYDELNSTLLKYDDIGLIISNKYESTVNMISHFMETEKSKRLRICQIVERLNESELFSSTYCSISRFKTEYRKDLFFHHLLDRNGLSTYLGQCQKYIIFPKNCRMNIGKNEKNNVSITPPSMLEKITIRASDFGLPSWSTFSIKCSNVETKPNFHEVEGYLNNIGTFVSIICYTFLIHTYRINNRLWNIPGQLVVALCSSLLVGDVMYLVNWFLTITGNNKIQGLCKMVAITTHLSLVIAHTLNVVIGYDLVMRFMLLHSRWFIKDTKRLIQIIIGVISGSTVLVLLSVLCDYFNILLIGYGSDGICVPYKPKGRLYFYIIPVVFTFLLSLVCIFIVVFNIWKESTKNQKTFCETVGRRNINLILLTLKLTLTLGLIEGIGFVQVIELNDKPMLKSVFSLLYSLVRSLRGLILVVIFVCRKDALQVYREKFKKVDIAIELRNLEVTKNRFSST